MQARLPVLFLNNNDPVFYTLFLQPIFWTLFLKYQMLKKCQVNLMIVGVNEKVLDLCLILFADFWNSSLPRFAKKIIWAAFVMHTAYQD